MDWAFLVVLLFISWPSLLALFTVDVVQLHYEAEYQGQVTMGCRFQPVPTSVDLGLLTVTWQRVSDTDPRDVLLFKNGAEDLQDARYRGRVRLLTEELKNGLAKIQISNIRINDSGTYRCLVEANGADYKQITLSVTAPYKNMTKSIQSSAKGEKVQLTCQSVGYPALPITWTDGDRRILDANHSAVVTLEHLYRVTSQIQVSRSEKNNYTCSFPEDGPSARFHIPDEIPTSNKMKDPLFIALSITMVLIIIVATALSIWKTKVHRYVGTPNTKRPLVDIEESASAIRPFDRADVENLKEHLKARYLRCYLHEEVRHHCEAFCEAESALMLQNRESQPVDLHTLLPKAGETLLLEDTPEMGKTTIAQYLVSSWVNGPLQHTPISTQIPHTCYIEPNSHLLLLVDCGNARGNLFQEIISQLDLGGNFQTEDDLRTVLNTSTGVYLLVDGYREGNHKLDESLATFISENKECRILILACPGHCPRIKEQVGPTGVLKLQTRTHEN